MADITNIIKTVVKADDQATAQMRKIGLASKDLESTFKKLGAAIGVAFSVKIIKDFAEKSVDAAIKQDRLTRSIAATDIALRRVGANTSWKDAVGNAKREVETLKVLADSYGLTNEQVFTLRQSLAEPLSAFSDMQINNLVPRLAAAGNLLGFSADKVASEVDAALDSRLKAKSADFTKSLGIDVAAVNKMTPMRVLAEFSKSLDRLQPAMDEYARTNPEASLARAKNDLEEIKTKLGMAILPKLVDFLKQMEKPIADFAAALNSADFQKFLSALATAAGWAVQNPGTTAAGVAVGAVSTNLAAEVIGGLILAKIMGTGGKALGKQLELFGLPTKMSKLAPITVPTLFITGSIVAAKLLTDNVVSQNRAGNLDMSNAFVMGGSGIAGGPGRISLPRPEGVDTTFDYLNQSFTNFGDVVDNLLGSVTDFVSESEKMDMSIAEMTAGLSMAVSTRESILMQNEGMTLRQLQLLDLFGDVAKITSKPIKIEVSLKADMPYQANLGISGLGADINRKVASRVAGRAEVSRIGG